MHNLIKKHTALSGMVVSVLGLFLLTACGSQGSSSVFIPEDDPNQDEVIAHTRINNSQSAPPPTLALANEMPTALAIKATDGTLEGIAASSFSAPGFGESSDIVTVGGQQTFSAAVTTTFRNFAPPATDRANSDVISHLSAGAGGVTLTQRQGLAGTPTETAITVVSSTTGPLRQSGDVIHVTGTTTTGQGTEPVSFDGAGNQYVHDIFTGVASTVTVGSPTGLFGEAASISFINGPIWGIAVMDNDSINFSSTFVANTLPLGARIEEPASAGTQTISDLVVSAGMLQVYPVVYTDAAPLPTLSLGTAVNLDAVGVTPTNIDIQQIDDDDFAVLYDAPVGTRRQVSFNTTTDIAGTPFTLNVPGGLTLVHSTALTDDLTVVGYSDNSVRLLNAGVEQEVIHDGVLGASASTAGALTQGTARHVVTGVTTAQGQQFLVVSGDLQTNNTGSSFNTMIADNGLSASAGMIFTTIAGESGADACSIGVNAANADQDFIIGLAPRF